MIEYYRGYRIESVVRKDAPYLLPFGSWSLLLPIEPVELFHIVGPGLSWLSHAHTLEAAKVSIDLHLVIDGDLEVRDFFPGVGL